VFKYLIVGGFIFAIFFAAFENYTFWNTGYPPTFNPSQPNITLSFENILAISTVDLVHGIKNTPAFALLTLEHGEPIVLSINLYTYYNSYERRVAGEFNSLSRLLAAFNDPASPAGGLIEVHLSHTANCYSYFRSANGNPYNIKTSPWPGNTFYLYTPSQVAESLQQIDVLGLQWFYGRAIEEYQNKTGTIPEINDLQVHIQCYDYKTYWGLALTIKGLHTNNDNSSSVFSTTFQPDGTILQNSIFALSTT